MLEAARFSLLNSLLFDPQANMASSVLKTSFTRFTQLERTSSLPTTSCGPSSCRHPAVAWTRRPHTLWREETLATGRIRSTEWSGGWTKVMVSCSEGPRKIKMAWLWLMMHNLFSPSYRLWWKPSEIKPNMTETTSKPLNIRQWFVCWLMLFLDHRSGNSSRTPYLVSPIKLFFLSFSGVQRTQNVQ